MALVYVLYEHAAGYALFQVNEFEFIGSVQDLTEDSIRFTKAVRLVAFSPFTEATVALDSINSLTEGVLPQTLSLFLKQYLPKGIVLGLSDVKISPEISEAFNVKCEVSGGVQELLRGIREHFHRLVKDFTPSAEGVARLGLSHAYSRAKIKFNVHRTDNMIIQSISLMDQLDKDINSFSMRIREWYSYHFPELYKIVPDNYTFARVVLYVKNRKVLDESKLQGLADILSSSEKAQNVLSASRHSIGLDIQPIDLIAIQRLATRLLALADYRKDLAIYMNVKMNGIAPNLTQLIGDQVGARLIAHAGSLTNLAKYPASTVQVLGAEKALFRALKTRSNTPKHGLIFQSTFVGRANAKNKGRISRCLANKCSIASRIDCFSGFSSCVFGQKLRQQMEDRLLFYETGKKPKKNEAVMEDAVAAMLMEKNRIEKKKRKKDKKFLKQTENSNENVLLEHANMNSTDEPKKKKK